MQQSFTKHGMGQWREQLECEQSEQTTTPPGMLVSKARIKVISTRTC